VRKRNMEQAREYAREYRRLHPDKIKSDNQKFHERYSQDLDYRHRKAKKSREWYHANKKRAAARQQQYRQVNYETLIKPAIHKRRALKRAAEGYFSASDWTAIQNRQGHRCAHCGKRRKLTVDHILPLNRGGSNWPCNIQGLCLSCNCSKQDSLESEVIERA